LSNISFFYTKIFIRNAVLQPFIRFIPVIKIHHGDEFLVVLPMSKSVVVFISILIAVGMTAGIASADINITGLKFYDENWNGIYDNGDYGLQDWIVYLDYQNGTYTGLSNTTDSAGIYTIAGFDPYFNYTVREEDRTGWCHSNASEQDVQTIDYYGGNGPLAFVSISDMETDFTPSPDGTAEAFFGLNARIGDSVSGGGQREIQVAIPGGTYSGGAQSDSIGTAADYHWTSGKYEPFDASYNPSLTFPGIMELNGTYSYQNSWGQGGQDIRTDRPNAQPVRDIVVRLHVERPPAAGPRSVEVNNLTLHQGSIIYNLPSPYDNFNLTDAGDIFLLIPASNILSSLPSGTDIATGGFNLTGDIKLTWSSGVPSPNTNNLKIDILIGRFQFDYDNDHADFGNYQTSISGYKLIDIDGDGVEDTVGEGWDIILDNGTITLSNTTDEYGYFSFKGISPGSNYNLSEVLKPGYSVLDPSSGYYYPLSIDACDHLVLNFTNQQLETYCINGTKTNCTGGFVDGWKMTVYNETSDLEVGNNTTDANGYYEICGLVPGDYWICEEDRPGWTNLTDACWNFTIVDGNVTFDIQNAELLCINGTKYKDQEYGEVLEGFTIRVKDESGAEVGSNTTDEFGNYKICGLLPYTTYTVCEDSEPGYVNISPSCLEVPLYCGNVTNVNFVNRLAAYCINGTKTNCTGGFVDGWKMTVYNETSDLEVGNNTTHSGGYYEICGLVPGNYWICEEDRPGWTNLTDACWNFTIVDGNVTFDVQNAELICINGTKYKDQEYGEVLEGFTIRVKDESGAEVGSNTTDEFGNYKICGLLPYTTYTVCEDSEPGYVNISPSCLEVPLYCGNVTNVNFVNRQAATYCINGTKIESCSRAGIDGWKMTVFNETSGLEVGNNSTNQLGYYEICGLAPGYYWICEEEKDGYVNVSEVCWNFTILDGNVTHDFENTRLLCINGTKYKDQEYGEGLEGFIIRVMDGDFEVGSNTTDSNGYYEICGLLPSVTYTVCEDPKPGYTNISPSCVDVTLECENATVNFVNRLTELLCISGYKRTSGGVVLSGWNITLTNGSYTTSMDTGLDGKYEFCGLLPGTYTLTEQMKANWQQISSPAPVILTDTNVTNQNFTNDPGPNVCCYCSPYPKFSVTKLPVDAEGYPVQFIDESTGPIAVKWKWTFDDGAVSYEQNPLHHYQRTGSYDVTLAIQWLDCDGKLSTKWKTTTKEIRVR